MVFLGTQDGLSFHDTMNEVFHWPKTLEQKSSLKRQTRDSPMSNFVGDPLVVKTKGAPKEKKGEANKGALNATMMIMSDDDDSSDKTGSGTQANFGIEEVSKIQYCISVILDSNVDCISYFFLGFGLGDSGLNNSHRAPIPPYESCTTRTISEVQWNAVALSSIVTFIEALDQLMNRFDPEITKITLARDRKSVTIELTDAKTKEPMDTIEKNIYLYNMLFSGRPSNGLTLSKAIDATVFDA
ncbi:hypothetical protein Ahy_A03g014129 isoform A [Arachis hypogaea]|uniref:Uncharacterized protein n=1 Tax=Arachis hypogaea TaxID=3818 RepID=A0A445DX20_ARAHY|nr:hypothetical protein Ahy_A03g014129 isoform A [Arachis hypogaea]